LAQWTSVYSLGDGRLSQFETNVLDVIGRDSARIRALSVPDMQVSLGTPSTSTAIQSSFEQQVAEATLVFADEHQSGMFPYDD